jgi:hypothetical protein
MFRRSCAVSYFVLIGFYPSNHHILILENNPNEHSRRRILRRCCATDRPPCHTTHGIALPYSHDFKITICL